MCCGSHFHFSLRAQRGIVALQRVAWDGGEKGHCCVFVSVLVSYVVPQERLVVVNHGWQSEATDGPRVAKRKESAKWKKSADRSGKYFSTPETWTVECNCRRILANIWFSQVWKHSSYTYAIPWCFKIWAWLRHEFLETAIPWWFTSKFWPRHELGMSLSFDCTMKIWPNTGFWAYMHGYIIIYIYTIKAYQGNKKHYMNTSTVWYDYQTKNSKKWFVPIEQHSTTHHGQLVKSLGFSTATDVEFPEGTDTSDCKGAVEMVWISELHF